jgi:uncharacterized RDD family membrane protein YckC
MEDGAAAARQSTGNVAPPRRGPDEGATLSLSVSTLGRGMQGQRAGVVSRFLADAIDLFVVIAAVVVIHLTVSGLIFLLHPRRFTWPEVTFLRHGTLGWVLLIAYLTIGWANTGRTVGKRVLGLRVVTSRDARLPLWRSFVRASLCALFPIGLFWSAASSRQESVQDLIVRTHVVYDWRPGLPPVER